MKANELRIGNLLEPKEGYTNQFKGYRAVTAIYETNAVVENHYPLSWFQPIPLTPEILERCKDVSKSYYTYELCVKQDLMYITWHPRAGLNILVSHETEDKNITISGENLHDLQNLYYALTGTELTISHNNK